MAGLREVSALCIAALLAIGALAGCGTDIQLKDLDEPCTRTDQCIEGLACLSGVCLESSDAGVDGAMDANLEP